MSSKEKIKKKIAKGNYFVSSFLRVRINLLQNSLRHFRVCVNKDVISKGVEDMQVLLCVV